MQLRPRIPAHAGNALLARTHLGPTRTSCSRRGDMNILSCYQRDGVLQAGVNVILFQIRVIILNNLVEGQTLVNQFEYVLHRDTCAFNDRFAKMNLRVDDNSFHRSPHYLILSPTFSHSSSTDLAQALISSQYTSAFSARTSRIVFLHVVLLITGTPVFDLNLNVRLPLSTVSLISLRISAGGLFATRNC